MDEKKSKDEPEFDERELVTSILPQEAAENLALEKQKTGGIPEFQKRKRGRPGDLSPAQLQDTLEAIQQMAPSATRSHVLSAYMLCAGFGPKQIVKIVKEAARAKLYIFNKLGEEIKSVPDYAARRWAAEFASRVHGYLFMAVQNRDPIPPDLMAIYREIRFMNGSDLDRMVKQGQKEAIRAEGVISAYTDPIQSPPQDAEIVESEGNGKRKK